MNAVEMQESAEHYQERFGNLESVAHPSIMCDPRFFDLLETALATGTILSRTAVEAVFGELPWDEPNQVSGFES